VKVAEFDMEKEGVVLEQIGNDRVVVDFGDGHDEFDVNDCRLICRGEEYELNDKVKFMDGGLKFVGHIFKINENGTYDIKMLGDDPDDIEFGVSPDKIRKIMTNRSVATARFRKVSYAIIASSKMLKPIPINKPELENVVNDGDDEASPIWTSNISRGVDDPKIKENRNELSAPSPRI